MKTLPDFLEPGLELLSIGLNPSLPSVRDGFYFANPRNRFWRALNASRLLEAPVVPGVEAHAELLKMARIGFTDVVKRPSAGASALRAADFERWAPELRQKLVLYQPGVAWFHGKIAYQQFLRATGVRRRPIEWGRQPTTIGSSVVFVSPNPSSANAAYSLDVLVGWYNQLETLVPTPD